jgi:Fe2+ transport system protein FeoA
MPVQAHNAHPKRRTNEGAENYAKAIYELQEKDASAVRTTDVAQRLGVAPASASGMLKRLAEEGVVEYQPYHGARLTVTGKEPFGGPVLVEIGDRIHPLGPELAASMRVSRTGTVK